MADDPDLFESFVHTWLNIKSDRPAVGKLSAPGVVIDPVTDCFPLPDTVEVGCRGVGLVRCQSEYRTNTIKWHV